MKRITQKGQQKSRINRNIMEFKLIIYRNTVSWVIRELIET